MDSPCTPSFPPNCPSALSPPHPKLFHLHAFASAMPSAQNMLPTSSPEEILIVTSLRCLRQRTWQKRSLCIHVPSKRLRQNLQKDQHALSFCGPRGGLGSIVLHPSLPEHSRCSLNATSHFRGTARKICILHKAPSVKGVSQRHPPPSRLPVQCFPHSRLSTV